MSGPFSVELGTPVTTRFVGMTAAGVLTDPASINVTVEKPDESFATSAPVHDSTGKYHLDIPTDQAGVWTVRWNAVGNGVDVVKSGNFIVDADPID